jgi:hypothetical protein
MIMILGSGKGELASGHKLFHAFQRKYSASRCSSCPKVVIDEKGGGKITWLFHDEATPTTRALLNRLATETGLVPAWWFIETTNVLAIAERKGSYRSDAV